MQTPGVGISSGIAVMLPRRILRFFSQYYHLV